MIDDNDTRMLSIGQVVARLHSQYPDVSPSSLRFLEREGLVEPHRTPGGHRLFSEKHINQIRRIKEWQRERLSLAEIRERLEAANALPDHAELGHTFVELASSGDAPKARRTILSAYEAGMPFSEIYDDVLRPALYEVGQRWVNGELTIVQEHEITAIVRDLIGELSSHTQRPDEPAEIILAACVAGETHDLGLRMVSHLLETEGHVVHFLGANVPPDSILDGIRMRNATAVLLSTTIAANVPALRRTLELIKNLPNDERPRVIVGGQVLETYEEELRAYGAELITDMNLTSARMTSNLLNLLGD
jgi:MerR family transcriptional regulator, light-induced transcriptional regulator